ncbi:MAG: ABC transporter ATP-binding protein [Actinomycetota bacterium]|nr:ABC transporter ATP-binding protein [Actinomycetota bacterium]MDQ6946819.1 ABC transporter ATP-binding protein [Actinomycetota bacterium]
MKLLEVENLSVSFSTPDGVVQAVRDVSFEVERGSTLGIVGESGSGKSVSTQTIVGLTQGAKISGRAIFEGKDLLAMTPDQLRSIRGPKISMIFQDPLSSLHPYYRVGWQIVEMIRAHESMSKSQARSRAIDLLGLVGIPQPQRRVDEYPHQFSGGMRQRAMIALALALSPALIIADEPTTALDVTVQAQIIDLLKRLQNEFGTAIVMITHDLGVIADMAHEVMIMYAGRAMEKAERRTAYYEPHHPYTVGLLRSLPGLGDEGERLVPIQGQPPSLINPPPGCPFAPRCRFAMAKCRSEEPPLAPVGRPSSAGHRSACWLPADLVGTSDAVNLRRHQVAGTAPPDEVTPSRAGLQASAVFGAPGEPGGTGSEAG